ncbi:GumC family protein [Chelativorans salis]|uniref:Exopolysaccharide transport family protein n=1 Tax=Chelativorans salis TaxID=2978478 RepID=A0ABT2LP18_9HYPH|nr:exopolysaccharide transport family protein [Chelativorans sp. EGI FJ00035]MCT7375582.1 exopolysaccharide transport family protein [Chelativorans sp. EGI FJ00035]
MVIQEIRKLSGERGAPAASKEYITFRDIWSFLRRHILLIILMTMVGIALGGLYIAKTEPTYSAIARLVIDHEQARIASQDASTGTIIIEAAEIASEVEIVKSEAIARAVIKELNLLEDPEILESRSWRSTIRSGIVSLFTLFQGEPEASGEDAAGAQTEEETMRRTMAGFLSRVSVRRVGQSYVLEIGYTSTDPVKAANAANAIARAYMQASLNAKAEALTRGAAWLEDRLIDVAQQAREAALAVEEYRNKNGITQVGAAASLDHQQLSEISTQLLVAQANRATESAKLATINRLLAGDIMDGYVGEALNNTQIYKLREDLQAAAVKLETLQSRYGAGGAPVRAAEEEIAQLEGEIRRELVRIQGVYKTNLETAITREKLLSEQLDGLKQTTAGTNLARVELGELESRAATYRRMYENLLQQLLGALQKQSFPIGDARFVTAATPPLSKIWPKTTLVLPFSMMLGFAAGIGLAGAREVFDRRIGSGERLGRELGLPMLGHVPATRFRSTWNISSGSETGSLRYVLDAPYSNFSEALRSVKNSIDATFPANGSIVLGITSVDAGEGKTTIATNLAQLYLNEGVSVILVDANFPYPHISHLAAGQGEDLGLTMAQLGSPPSPSIEPEKVERPLPRYSERKTKSRFAEMELKEKEGGQPLLPEKLGELAMVPVLTVDQIKRSAHPSHRYGHLPALKAQVDMLRDRYTVVIVDLSAFESSVDARVASSYLDGILLVLGNHRKMTVERLAEALATFGKSRVSILGVIFNRSTRRRRPPGALPASQFYGGGHGTS